MKVKNITVKHSDASNCDYKIVEFKGVKILGNREIKTNVTGTRTLWPAHKMDVNGEIIDFKGDVEYDNVVIGDFFDGAVQGFETTPYDLNGRQVTSYKCVVFSHENGLAVAARALRKNNAAPLDDDGVPFQLAGSKPAAKVAAGEDMEDVDETE